MAEQYPREDMVVVLGTPTAESSRLYALTVTEGDPSWAGALGRHVVGAAGLPRHRGGDQMPGVARGL